ncbi:MAG TPA: HAMP domain-containing sensor histidine kinase, partial [Armatimonadota bacterium]|nr:HAMP domain-containing sensor histidine kinase [Armatimonadota bacterium]
TGIVDMVRQFSRERQAGMTVVPVTEVLDDVIALQRFDEAVRRTQIETEYACHPEVDGNADRLRQVFLNLIRNAGQALQGRPDGRIIVRVRQEDQQVIIEVADNGPGVPAEIQERIWEPFYTTRGAEGTGLGLDICRQIVAQHRGTIGLESEPGRGATFTVRLPASGSRPPEETEDANSDGENDA